MEAESFQRQVGVVWVISWRGLLYLTSWGIGFSGAMRGRRARKRDGALLHQGVPQWQGTAVPRDGDKYTPRKFRRERSRNVFLWTFCGTRNLGHPSVSDRSVRGQRTTKSRALRLRRDVPQAGATNEQAN